MDRHTPAEVEIISTVTIRAFNLPAAPLLEIEGHEPLFADEGNARWGHRDDGTLRFIDVKLSGRAQGRDGSPSHRDVTLTIHRDSAAVMPPWLREVIDRLAPGAKPMADGDAGPSDVDLQAALHYLGARTATLHPADRLVPEPYVTLSRADLATVLDRLPERTW